jgi:hypothetical protein
MNMKKSKRSQSKYPALEKRLNLRRRNHLIDYDYLGKLSEKELEWLNKFTEEYVGAKFDTENPRRNLHKKKEQRSECYRRNNARNKDLYTIMMGYDAVEFLSAIEDKYIDKDN